MASPALSVCLSLESMNKSNLVLAYKTREKISSEIASEIYTAIFMMIGIKQMTLL